LLKALKEKDEDKYKEGGLEGETIETQLMSEEQK